MIIEVSIRTYPDDDRYSSKTGRQFQIDVADAQAPNLKLEGVIGPMVASCIAEHIATQESEA